MLIIGYYSFTFFRLISLFAAYLIFGFLYQRFVAQAKGFEQIPNFAFWKKVGNMSAVSIKFQFKVLVIFSFVHSIFQLVAMNPGFFTNSQQAFKEIRNQNICNFHII